MISGDITIGDRIEFSFGPNPPSNPPASADYLFNIADFVVKDSIDEYNEGFVVLLEQDASNTDNVRVTRNATLVTILDVLGGKIM